jgi:hypothetical protein
MQKETAAMRLSRLAALIFILLALAAGLYDLSPAFEGEAPRLHGLGEIWFALSPGSLNLLQAVTQRYLWPPLWDPGMTWLLVQPALAVFALPAAFFALISAMKR